MSASIAIFFGALGIWPDLAVLRRPGIEPHLLRSFVLGASLAIIFGFATVFVFYSLLAIERWRWSLEQGYPWWVIADVFCDTRRDAGSLINGNADFVLVPGPTRSLLLRVRRARLLIQVAGAVVALIGIARWLSVWLSAGGSEPVQAVAMHWAVPILVSYVLFFALGIPESRVRRSERLKSAGAP